MQILLACAKLMADSSLHRDLKVSHRPVFGEQADMIASEMCRYSVSELEEMLHINHDIAVSTFRRYDRFFDKSTCMPAIGCYDGIVFKNIDAGTLSDKQLEFADRHVNICSFVYGLLRPLDAINPYRMEGCVGLPAAGTENMFDYWRPKLTEELIRRVKADDGTLVNLASNEMRKLFDWKQVCAQLNVISPEFKIESSGKLRTVTVYAKICRGAMTRFIIEQELRDLEGLKLFDGAGFRYESGEKTPLFVARP